MLQRNSTLYTIVVATILCVVCSFMVSAAAVVLRPYQEANKRLDRQRNILDAAGLAIGEFGLPASELTRKQVDELYDRVSEKLVDLETGEYNTDLDPKTYDPREAIDNKDQSIAIEDVKYNPGERRREKVARVYFVKKPGSEKIDQVVLPIYGKGLWSTLYGFMALKSDLTTISGLTFYEHGETPGLGGEVDNQNWKQQWNGQKLYNEKGEPAAFVYKGAAPPDNPYAVDGLSGATITSNGVTNLMRYWASDDGYGHFLDKLAGELSSESDSDQVDSSTSAQVDNDIPNGDA
ncbi:Na(+)-translocating NADH-quinone reductase subunit C [Novipirellula aureliae]|uniref:Na(+)-translocating NADH-quinone reductase subunit C n=1 Tax=Novipirellula aureliae TaxID=2527966 RepID=A0A5C6E9S2_9BACT|nr:Na(+)-translocating NADH-quinone reductase subunit C [Novipirellula aureliae]TWU45742.1 Na(+)-translocating NADH-quinone reductase subunit C [Novipirellula aureliae]